MITEGEKILLQETLKAANKGILKIENFLSNVENEDLNKDLNRQLNRLHKVADKSKKELKKEGFETELSEWTKSADVLVKVTNYFSDKEIAHEIIHDCITSVDNISEVLANQESLSGNSYKLATDLIADESDYINILKAYL